MKKQYTPFYKILSLKGAAIKSAFFMVLLVLSSILKVVAQQKDTLKTISLAPVSVYTTRLETNEKRLPLALTVVDGSRLQVGQPQISLFESLGAVAGVFAQNPDNFAQDLRISIRGFGARAAFGIRGIRLVIDGIPESTPDGQADIDNLDVGAVRRLEVLRGPSSGLYGNAAGGVLNLQTQNANEMPLAEMQFTAGNYGLRSYRFKSAKQLGKFQYVLMATNNQTEGYRANSQMRSTILNLKLHYDFDSLTRLSVLANYGNSPTANDPGGLTMAQVNENLRQAHPNNLKFLAGEGVEQGRVGVTFEKRFNRSLIFIRTFGTKRDFENYLAFQNAGAGSINRTFSGVSVHYQYAQQSEDISYQFRVGGDLENQADTRRRYDNLIGVRGKITFDQVERFKNVAFFITQELSFKSITFLSGLRSDAIKMSATDNFLTDGNQSGNRNFRTLNPTVGISWAASPHINYYVNVGTSFETPTLSELSNNPTGAGGLNPDLNPQQATNAEIGLKTFWLDNKLRFDATVFNINVTNELVPYQIAGQSGRVFYRNAGNSQRQGIEISFNALITKGLTLFSNYTFSNFIYRNYKTLAGDFAGKTLPGIPKHVAQAELRYFGQKGTFGIIQLRYASDFYADDANAVSTPAYTLLNLRVGKTITIPLKGKSTRLQPIAYSLQHISIEPFVGINNALNISYFQNVQINAANGRYFEPAQGRFWFGGIKVGI